VTLPVSGLQLQGLDVELAVITDYRGITALACVAGTGKFTVWGGFNQNGKVVNGTFTFTAHGTGSDGSTFNNHVTDHFNERPDGTVNAFFHCH
jgi:hypothetical protein